MLGLCEHITLHPLEVLRLIARFASAEEGCYFKPAPAKKGEKTEWVNMVSDVSMQWKAPCTEILSYVRYDNQPCLELTDVRLLSTRSARLVPSRRSVARRSDSGIGQGMQTILSCHGRVAKPPKHRTTSGTREFKLPH